MMYAWLKQNVKFEKSMGSFVNEKFNSIELTYE